MITIALLYLLIGGFDIVSFGFTKPIIFAIISGFCFWVMVWAFGGTIIDIFRTPPVKPFTVGTVYGMCVGAATAGLLIVIPYCSEPSDPTPQQFLLGMGEPAILIYSWLYEGVNSSQNSLLFLFTSTAFWGVFGVILSLLITRKFPRAVVIE